MKTRIISGIVLGIVFGGIVVASLFVSPYFMTAAVVFLTVLAIYELLHTALGINNKTAYIGAMIYGGITAILHNSSVLYLFTFKYLLSSTFSVTNKYLHLVYSYSKIILPVAFFFFAAAVILAKHNDFDIGKMFGFAFMPYVLAYAFNKMASVILTCNENGVFMPTKARVYYLLLMLSFSSVCDMGAYFTGVTCGKHKLCPEISPKKTIEGAIGGIISTMIVVFILMVAFDMKGHILATVLFTIPLCILGMMGDLFASIIKRKVGIKDYGKLIPGHGGVLDRFDSILFIAPALNILISCGVI